MESTPLTLNIIPYSYKVKFKWGYFQKVRIFLQNTLKKEAIFIRGLNIYEQLPDNILWYGGYFGDVIITKDGKKCIHHLLAQRNVPPIFAKGLILPNQQISITMGMRFHTNIQHIKIGYNVVDMEIIKRAVYFKIPSKFHLIYYYETPQGEGWKRKYYTLASIPKNLQERTVIIRELDKFSLKEKSFKIKIELEDQKNINKIKKILNLDDNNTYYYYCEPINQWFIKINEDLYIIEKKKGKLELSNISFFDIKILDIIENSIKKESGFLISEKDRTILKEITSKKYYLEIHGNFCYININTIKDIIKVLKENQYSLKLNYIPHEYSNLSVYIPKLTLIKNRNYSLKG